MNGIFWLVVLVAILGVLFVAKLSHLKHRLSITGLILFLLFVYITFVVIADNNSVDIGSFKGFFTGIKVYFSWLGHIFGNVRTITGNVVRMDWITNSTG